MSTPISADSPAPARPGTELWDVERIVTGLKDCHSAIPREAIEQARRQREAIVPRLIDELNAIVAAARRGILPDGPFTNIASYLLSEFQAREALPTLLELITLPGNLPEDLLEEDLTETMSRILPQLGGDDWEVIDAVIHDPKVNEYSRWAVATGYEHLVRAGKMTRDEAVRRLEHHLRDAIDRGDDRIGTGLVLTLCNLGGRAAYDTIAEAFEAGIVDPHMTNLQEVEEELGEGDYTEKRQSHLPPTGITDTIAELQRWDWGPTDEEREAQFEDELLSKALNRPEMLRLAQEMSLPEVDLFDRPEELGTSRHFGPVGRNDLCPCGSGKKYKKCCGKPGA